MAGSLTASGPAFYFTSNTVGNSSPLLLPGSIGYIRLRGAASPAFAVGRVGWGQESERRLPGDRLVQHFYQGKATGGMSRHRIRSTPSGRGPRGQRDASLPSRALAFSLMTHRRSWNTTGASSMAWEAGGASPPWLAKSRA